MDSALLKVGGYHGKAVTGTPLLAVFNTRPYALTEIISLDSFPGVVASTKYIIMSHNSGKVTPVTDSEAQTSRLGITLEVGGFDIFTAYPVTQFDSETNGRISTASLGLIGKMTGAAAIVDTRFEILPTRRAVSVTRLKALGTLGKLSSHVP